jgi:hypothetical protein
LQLLNERGLLVELSLQRAELSHSLRSAFFGFGNTHLGRGPRLPLVPQHLDRAQHALFKRRKIVGADGQRDRRRNIFSHFLPGLVLNLGFVFFDRFELRLLFHPGVCLR